MTKKKHRNYRAEQARRKNEEERLYRAKKKAQKEFWDKNGKQIVIAAAIIVAVLIVASIVYSFFFGPGGSLPRFGDKLRGVEENWIVTDLSDTSKKRYFKLGEMNTPEGYTIDEAMSSTSDQLEQSFYYRADDENAMVPIVYVSGVANYSAEEQLKRLVDYGYFAEEEGSRNGTIAGKDLFYDYFVFDVSADRGSEEGTILYASLVMYMNCTKDSCVLMMLNSAEGAREELPTSAELIAEAEKLLPLLTVEK